MEWSLNRYNYNSGLGHRVAQVDPVFATLLTHVGAREYDPGIGWFLSVDPILNTADHQSFSGWTYADNRSVTSSDPAGLAPCVGGVGRRYYAGTDPGGNSHGGANETSSGNGDTETTRG
jgi:RHS repeat-associated protein